MALLKLPPLPEGLHPYISMFKDSNSKNGIYIFSSDSPQYFEHRNYNCYMQNVETVHWYSPKEQKWIAQSNSSSISDINLIYTNHDILKYSDKKTVEIKKTPDATSIKIEGGSTRTLKKGMVWNVGEAIDVLPVNAFQSATFEISNPAVCTVDETGKIKAVGEGDCIITITTK